MTSLKTPNECFQYAKDAMLDGKEPSTDLDWMKIVNCWAANVIPAGVPLLCLIFKCPLPPAEVKDIIQYQTTGTLPEHGMVITAEDLAELENINKLRQSKGTGNDS